MIFSESVIAIVVTVQKKSHGSHWLRYYEQFATFLLQFFLHRVNFALCPSSYVFLHASRKTFSNVKVSISAQWTPSLQNQSLSPDQVATEQQPVGTAHDPSALFALMCCLFARLLFSSGGRHGRAITCLRMRRRPRCSWEPSTPSSSSHTRW